MTSREELLNHEIKRLKRNNSSCIDMIQDNNGNMFSDLKIPVKYKLKLMSIYYKKLSEIYEHEYKNHDNCNGKVFEYYAC